MKPIRAPRLLQTGIAIFVPGIEDFSTVKIEIFYSPKNPLFAWSFCDESPYKIWEKMDQAFDKGLLFIYNTPTFLSKGYYKIKITMFNTDRSSSLIGSETYGILEDKATLYIGLPYSTFAPIQVT